MAVLSSILGGGGGAPQTTKWLLWMTTNHHIWGSISFFSLVFGPCLFYWRLPSLWVVVTIFGRSRDQSTKTRLSSFSVETNTNT